MIQNVGSFYSSLSNQPLSRHVSGQGRSGSVFKQALEQELLERPQVQQQPSRPVVSPHRQVDDGLATRPRSNPSAGRSSNPYAHLQPMIEEVRQIAEDAGYIGVSPQDIVRAYKGGHSFLADYKV